MRTLAPLDHSRLGAADLDRHDIELVGARPATLVDVVDGLSTANAPLRALTLDLVDAAPAQSTTWPQPETMATMVRAGIATLRLGLPPAEAFQPLGAARLVAFLALAAQVGIPIEWSADLAALGLPHEHLHHLPPPGGDNEAARRWRDDYSYGQCYYRLGGSFVQVFDARTPPNARFTIDAPDYVRTFLDHIEPGRLAEVPSDQLEALDHLLAEHLLLSIGTGDDAVVVTAPYRLQRWPVPILDM